MDVLNWCFQIVVLDKTLESSWDCKEIKIINPKGNQLWIFIGRTDAEAEAPKFWQPDVKSQLIGKNPDIEKDWGQEEKGKTEDKMIGWHHRLDEHEFQQAPGVVDGQGSLECWSPSSRRESDTTEWLDWTESFLQWKLPKPVNFTSKPVGIFGEFFITMCPVIPCNLKVWSLDR